MAFVRILTTLLRDKAIGPRIVPIVPDESRTFGMEGLFRQIGIFSQEGQLYRPQDADQLMYYREDPKGQILQEGINEPGAMASFIAAGTSYSTSNMPMIPFYVYYSMFGFQRVGDLAWAAGDMRTRGFLIGGTSGRTTLNGEGLQHEDGHSHVLASTIPNCVGYDPTYAYEVAVIIRSGLKRMYVDNEDVYFYITTLNENYPHPAMPEGAEEGILKGMYKLRTVEAEGDNPTLKTRLLGSGAILREVEAGAELLAKDFGVSSEIWSVTSFTELRRDGLETERWNMLHPEEPAARFLCRAGAGQGRRAGHRRHRLHQGDPRRHPALRARAIQGARHRWFRPLRLPQKAASLLRGRPLSRRGRGAEGARRRSVAAGQARIRGDRALSDRSRAGEPGAKLSSFANSIPKTLARRRSWRGENRSQSSRHRRFQGRADHRNPGQAGRVGQGRAILGDPGVGQGDDGRARAGLRRRRRDSRQDRRQGLDGRPVADAGRGGRRRASSGGAAAAPAAPAPAPASPPARAATPSERRGAGESGRPARQRFRSGGRAQSSGGRLLRRQRRTRRSPSREGTRHRPDDDQGHRGQGPHHPRGRQGRVERRRAGRGSTGGAALPEIPAVDFAKFGPVETVPLSRIKRISGPRLHASWVNVPHVTHSDEADVTDLETFRKSLDDAAKSDKKAPYRVSLLPLLMKASVASLKAFPTFNSALAPAKDALIYRKYWHLGVAVDTPEGLVVAVVRDVDQKGVLDLARELGALSAKAREGKLSPAEMQGATFTISSLGGIGGTAFTPIVNAPEVAILGVVRSKMAPVWDGEAFQPRLMLPLCLSYDHRVIDGAAAARFLRHLCQTIEDMRRVLL